MSDYEWKTAEAPRLLAMTSEELDAYYAEKWGWGINDADEEEDNEDG